MDTLRKNNVIHHIYCTKGQPDNEILITDTFFLKFKDGTSDDVIRQYLLEQQLQIVHDYGESSLLVRVTDGTGMNPIGAANLAADRGDVEYAEPNLVRRLERFHFTPADPLFPLQWHLFSHPDDDLPNLVKGAGIDAPNAWSETLGIRDVVVAVMDDGFDLTHPDFQGIGKVIGQLNVTLSGPFFNLSLAFDNDVHPRPGNYHGTPCLGVAVAEMNGQGTVGVAPGCGLLAVRFPLNMPDSLLAELFTRVSKDADVVSCSWGVPPGDTPMSSTLRQRISQLAATGGRRGKGLVFCVAAGNNNAPVKDLDNTSTYLFLDSSGVVRSHSGPIERWIASHPDVMTISASTSLRTRSAYSSWGNEISVCAPSNNFHDLKQFTTTGRGIVTTDNEGFGLESDFSPGSRFTGQFGGTSSATPTAAGVCGLVISSNQSLSGNDVRSIIEATADKDMVIDSETAVNVPGDFQNGFSPWFGHGKVNAAAAVAAAASELPVLVSVDQLSGNTPIEIPDRGQTVISRIEIAEDGVVVNIRLGVVIRHTFIGDLRLDLVAPNGSSVNLHNQTGWSQDDLIRDYTIENHPAMGSLVDKSAKGTWELRVSDRWLFDVGRLESWRLRLKVANTR